VAVEIAVGASGRREKSARAIPAQRSAAVSAKAGAARKASSRASRKRMAAKAPVRGHARHAAG
jgi:hypothetical protein